MAKTSYALGLGSNRYRARSPKRIIENAIAALCDAGLHIASRSPIFITDPLGPGRRRFANAAILVTTDLSPDTLLSLGKTIERRFGRRPARRWGDRTLDIDILLWSEGVWTGTGLAIPHPAFRQRAFVLDPLDRIAAEWRDPLTGHTIRQLRQRLKRPIPVDPARNHP